MKLLYLWPLALLVLLPAIVILYLIRQKATDRKVSSVFLWREAYQNQRADTPWEKLKHNLLLYLQVIAMGLLVFAMTAPFFTGRVDSGNFHILILDRSASMSLEYEEGKTRLEAAKEEAARFVDGLSRDAKVTVIAADDTGTICINASENRDAVQDAIAALEPTMLAGDASAGLEMARSLVELYPDYELTAFTDTPVDFGTLTGARVDLSSEVDNVSVDLVSHTFTNGGVSVMVKASNHSIETDYRGDLSLFLEGELAAVQAVEIPYRSSGVFYFNLEPDYPEGFERGEGLLLTASLSGKDALPLDNEASELLVKSQEGRVLLVTERNTFLEQALKTNEELTVFVADTADAVEEGYGIYIFDGIFPEELPEEGAVFLLNVPAGTYSWLKPAAAGQGSGEPDGDAAGQEAGDAAEGGYGEDGSSGQGGYLNFAGMAAGDYMDGYRIGVAGWYAYERPVWGESFLEDGTGRCVGFIGMEAGRRVAVLGFDLHNGEFVLQPQFPIFIYQITEKLLEREAVEQREIQNFPPQESGVMASAALVAGSNGVADGNGAAGVSPETVLQMRQAAGIPIRNYLLAGVLVLLILISIVLITQGNRSIPVLRAVVAVLLILALFDITVQGRENSVTTVYLIDVSDSCEAHRAEAEEFVRSAMGQKKAKDKAAVIAFGGDARVEQFVSGENLFREVGTSPASTATNLERAVQTGLALLPDGAAGRMVILTDGGETDGDVRSMAAGITSRGVDLRVLQYGETEAPENYISRLETPSDVQVGEQFLITVEVESNCRTTAFISLYEGSAAGGGEMLKATKEVELSAGTNQFVFADTRTGEGLVTYRAVLESAEDGRTVNNQYTAFTKAEAASRLLLLESEKGESDALREVLSAAGVQVDVRPAGGAPETLLDLEPYAAVILLDVPEHALPGGFLSNLDTYVKDYGGGLIAVGGNSSYALGGYRDTVLEDVLPVSMDLKQDEEVPELSMVYVVDKSGSMGEGAMPNLNSGGGGIADDSNKLGVAKASVAEAVKNLREIDRVGVLAFDDAFEWVLPMTQADDQDTVQGAVASIQSGGGTSIFPALNSAKEALKQENSALKHIVLLTDGQDSFGLYGNLLGQMEEEGITLSCVAIGSDADTKLLEYLAENGNGRYYFSESLSELPYIFAQELYLSMGEFLVNREFVPVVTHAGEMLTGVYEQGLYPLLGYVAATPKPLATVYLESDSGDPILSGWQYGLGRTIAFQSDAVGNWTAYYAGQPEYAALWRNMVDWVRTELTDPDGTISVEKQGNGGKITYRTDTYGADTSVRAVYTDSEGNSRVAELSAVAPGVYESEMELEESEAYSLLLTKQEGDTVVAAQSTGIAMQYSREYQFADRTGLAELVSLARGRLITTPEEAAEGSRRTASEPRNLTLLFLAAAAILFFADIVLRRFAIRPLYLLASCWKRSAERRKGRRKERSQAAPGAGSGGGKPGQAAPGDGSGEGEQGAGNTAKRNSTRRNKAGKKVKQGEALLDTSALLKKKGERKR